MNRIKTVTTLITLSALAPFCAASSTSNTAWNQHLGTYLGARIGFNFTKVQIENTQDTSNRHGTVMNELMGGYYFSPHWAVEGGVGSYFSSLGLGMRLGLKASLPVSTRWNFSLQAGGNYISSFLENGIVGPYVSAGMEYSLSPRITLNIDANDLLSSTTLNLSDYEVKLNGNVFSMVIGFNYYLH